MPELIPDNELKGHWRGLKEGIQFSCHLCKKWQRTTKHEPTARPMSHSVDGGWHITCANCGEETFLYEDTEIIGH